MVRAHRRHRSLALPSHAVDSVKVVPWMQPVRGVHPSIPNKSRSESLHYQAAPQHLSPSPLQHLHLAQAQEAAAPALQQKHSGPMKALIQGRSKGGHSPQAPTEGPPCSPQSTVEASPPWGSAFVAMGAPMSWLHNCCNCVGFHF